MANEEHVKILKCGVEVWNKWRKENPNVTPDLEMTGFSEANLSGVNLIGADLRKANLNGSNLSGADLSRAGFSMVNLTVTNLIGADLSGADFSGANLSRTKLLKAKNLNETIGLPEVFLYFLEDNTNTILRSIEFSPEYKQAGMQILNYFGEILEQKYPDKKSKIIIEQDGLKVRMIIETPEGEKEKLEETLEEYGLVVTGKISMKKFFDGDEIQIMYLKHKLDMASMEIKHKQDMLVFSNQNIKELKEKVNTLESQYDQMVNLLSDSLRRNEESIREFQSIIKLISKNSTDSTKEALNIIKKCLLKVLMNPRNRKHKKLLKSYKKKTRNT